MATTSCWPTIVATGTDEVGVELGVGGAGVGVGLGAAEGLAAGAAEAAGLAVGGATLTVGAADAVAAWVAEVDAPTVDDGVPVGAAAGEPVGPREHPTRATTSDPRSNRAANQPGISRHCPPDRHQTHATTAGSA